MQSLQRLMLAIEHDTGAAAVRMWAGLQPFPHVEACPPVVASELARLRGAIDAAVNRDHLAAGGAVDSEMECPVCREPLSQEAECAWPGGCDHRIHQRCLSGLRAARAAPRCPVCRVDAHGAHTAARCSHGASEACSGGCGQRCRHNRWSSINPCATCHVDQQRRTYTPAVASRNLGRPTYLDDPEPPEGPAANRCCACGGAEERGNTGHAWMPAPAHRGGRHCRHWIHWYCMDRAWTQAAGGAGGERCTSARGQGTRDPVPLCPGCLSLGEVNPCEYQPRTEWEGGQDSLSHPWREEGTGQGRQRPDTREYEDEPDEWDAGASSHEGGPWEGVAADEGEGEGPDGLPTGLAARTEPASCGEPTAEADEEHRERDAALADGDGSDDEDACVACGDDVGGSVGAQGLMWRSTGHSCAMPGQRSDGGACTHLVHHDCLEELEERQGSAGT